jgi:hypothetical protein
MKLLIGHSLGYFCDVTPAGRAHLNHTGECRLPFQKCSSTEVWYLEVIKRQQSKALFCSVKALGLLDIVHQPDFLKTTTFRTADSVSVFI